MLKLLHHFFTNPQNIPALFSTLAAAASALAVWKAYDIAQQQHHEFRSRIQFHFNLLDRNDWSLSIFQIAGEPYHIPLIDITPTFAIEDGKPKEGLPIPKSLSPNEGGALPRYELTNLREEICLDQPVGDCSISSLLIRYEIYGVTHSRQLP